MAVMIVGIAPGVHTPRPEVAPRPGVAPGVCHHPPMAVMAVTAVVMMGGGVIRLVLAVMAEMMFWILHLHQKLQVSSGALCAR